MKRLILLALILMQSAGCARLGVLRGGPIERADLWTDAQDALAAQDFARAELGFDRLARDHSGTLEGRESLFYLGAIRIDPRNPEWDPRLAEDRLEAYMTAQEEGRVRLYRYREAEILHEIARQLNLPAESRVAGLQPEERVVTVEERVVVPAQQSREQTAEIERLRQQIAERDARIRQQQEEMERIRRTLTGSGPTSPASPPQ